MTAAAGPSTSTSTYITKRTTTTKFQSESGRETEDQGQEKERESESDLFPELPEAIRLSPSELLIRYQSPINVLAPLVRCSKLPFRHLCSLYETHITHTPMILAQEFSRAQVARVSDFSSSKNERGVFWMEPKLGAGAGAGTGTQTGNGTGDEDTEVVGRDRQDVERRADFEGRYGQSSRSGTSSNGSRPTPTSNSLQSNRLPHTPRPPTPHSQLISGQLIAQLASPNSASLADASELISPYVDGVDINCGCPQKWAYHEGIGCALLRKPELVGDMVRVTKDRLGWGYPVSIKIRIDPEESRTEQLVSNAIAMGVSHITIHGRTRFQASTEPVNLPGLAFAVDCIRGRVPSIANGDLWTLEDAKKMRGTGVDGVMGARGLLANPALFAGYETTPKHAIEQFINLSLDYGFIYPLFHKHLAYMLESRFTKPQRVFFNSLTGPVSAIDYLAEVGGVDIVSGRGTIWDARRGRSLI